MKQRAKLEYIYKYFANCSCRAEMKAEQYSKLVGGLGVVNPSHLIVWFRSGEELDFHTPAHGHHFREEKKK